MDAHHSFAELRAPNRRDDKNFSNAWNRLRRSGVKTRQLAAEVRAARDDGVQHAGNTRDRPLTKRWIRGILLHLPGLKAPVKNKEGDRG
jgi:hypothetical protein